jgi:hypothetical protein
MRFGQQIKVTEGANTVAARVTTYAYDRKNQPTQVNVDPNGLKLSTRHLLMASATPFVEQGTTSSLEPACHALSNLTSWAAVSKNRGAPA